MTSCSENNTNNKIAFKNYTTKNGLGSNYVTGVSVSGDGNTIYAATDGGVSIGTKSNSTWNFKNYTTAVGLGSNSVDDVYASSDGNTIYAATFDGLGVGTKKADGSYTFQNYTTKEGLVNSNVYSIYISAGGQTIYAGTEGGLSIGTKQAGNSYTFQNYTTKDGLVGNGVHGIYASSNGKEIYAATGNLSTGGISIGTEQTGGSYTFNQSYTKKDGLGANDVNCVYVSNDGKKIYAGTGSDGEGGLSIGTEQAGGSYTFQNYTTKDGLSANDVNCIYVSSNGKKIYAGTGSDGKGGLSIGTEQAGGSYTFKDYTTKDGLGSNSVQDIYVSSDGRTIYAATLKGLSISS